MDPFTANNLGNFATAHSRGLRLVRILQACLQATLPQRIRAGCDARAQEPPGKREPLPQRIRAGCDSSVVDLTITRPHFATAHSRGLRRKGGHVLSVSIDLCHSAFARVATERAIITTVRHDLCHSAFARVATRNNYAEISKLFFATAHSRGLRLRKSNAAHCEFAARR